MNETRIRGHLVDVVGQRVFDGTLVIDAGRIAAIEEHPVSGGPYVLPGFVDAHVHIESSMMPPASFAQLAVRFGTVATVSDPHEIANVLGVAGIEYMLASARQVPLKFHFGCPSCVPATRFETAGAILDSRAVAELLARDEIGAAHPRLHGEHVVHVQHGRVGHAHIAGARAQEPRREIPVRQRPRLGHVAVDAAAQAPEADLFLRVWTANVR